MLGENYVSHLSLQILFQDPIPKLYSLDLYDPLGHIDQPLHLRVRISQILMGSVLKLLQCAKFFNLHTLVVGAKLFKEFGDKVKSGKELMP
jgi:hypothetical protein